MTEDIRTASVHAQLSSYVVPIRSYVGARRQSYHAVAISYLAICIVIATVVAFNIKHIRYLLYFCIIAAGVNVLWTTCRTNTRTYII